MNQTQRNFAIKRIRTIINKKIQDLDTADSAEKQAYNDAVYVPIPELVKLITSRKVQPVSNAKLKKLGGNAAISEMFDFSKVREEREKKAKMNTPFKRPNADGQFYYLTEDGYRRSYTFFFPHNLKKAEELSEKLQELIDTIMLAGNTEAMAAVAAAELL